MGSKLKDGKQIPNNYTNRENLVEIFADVDVEEAGVVDKPFKTHVGAHKYIRPAKKYIEVTKTSNISSNQTITLPTQKVDYTLGLRAGYTISQISDPFYIKNFKLVDIFPKDLDLKEVTLNPEFENVGGTYRTELVDGVSKLIFSAPYVPSDLTWVAKISSSIKYGAPGNGTIVNKAYIDFEETETDTNKQIEHKNATPIAEEGNKRLTTANHSFKLLFNDSLAGRKYIRKSSVDGAWMNEIQTLPGETFEYKFEVSNNLALDVNKMEFFDLFPYDRDRLLLAGLTGNHPLRGSEFANTLVRVKSIRMINLKTGQSNDVEGNFPITYFKSRDGYPANLFGGTAKEWLERAQNNPDLQTTDPSEAIGIHIGGGGASTLSKYSRLEIVLEMKAPIYDFAHTDQWEGKRANNTFAMNYEGLSKYTEVPPVTNEMVTPKKNLTFKKVDKDTKQPLSGAKYRFEQDGLVKEAVSNPEGLIHFKNVNYKPYEIKEVEPPAGYKLDTQTYRKVLGYDDYTADQEKIRNNQPVDEVIQVFEDEKLPPVDNTKYTIKVHKKNKDTNLGNVKFKLENLSTREVLEGTTDLSGVFEFNNLKNGQYRLAELSNLNRFTLIEPISFELPLPDDFRSDSVESVNREVDAQNPDHKIYTFVIQNRTYNIEMVKLGVRDLVRTKKDTQRKTTEGELLANVNFELFDTGKTMTATGVVDSGTGDTSRGTYTTNARGRISVGGLAPHTIYKFVEIQAPAFYEKAEPVEFYVDDNGVVRSMDKEVYFRPEMLLITNYRQVLKSSMLIEKIDPDTQEKLPDATFKLYKNIGGQYRELEDENVVNKKYTQTTNEQGKLSFEDLTYGRYRVEEILPPNGYLKGVEPIEFTVDPYLSKVISKTVKNRKMDFSVVKVEELGGPYQTDAAAQQALEQMKQSRQDDEDLIVANRYIYKKLKGARLELKENYRDNNDIIVPLSTQDADGYSIYRYREGLSQYGAYTLKELTPPVGYVKAPDQTIKLDRLINYNNPKATFYLKNVRQKGQIHITKFEGRGNEVLPGAEFSIYAGHLTKEEARNATSIKTGVTNANGIVQFMDLDLGDYTIVETGAPQNYRRIEEVSHVSLTPNSTVARKSFYNKLDTTTIFLKKVDDNARPITDLTNSNFEFYYDGKLHSVGVPTGDAGMIRFENVPLIGDYKIRETSAPAGYVISGSGEQSFQATDAQPLNIDPQQNQVRIMQNKEQVTIRASKLWIGGNPAQRPEVYFKLFRTYEGGTSEEMPVPVMAVGRGDAQVEFGTFDKYKHLPDGTVKEYVYYVKETNEHGIELNVEEFFYESNTAQNTLNVTNTYHSPKTSLKVRKEWDLGEQATKPDLKFILFRKTDVAPQLQQVVGQEKLVPKTAGIIGTVLNQEISVEFTDLDLTDQNGNPYTYVVREVKADSSAIDETVNFVPENSFEREASKQAGDDFLSASFKNVYRSPKITVEATKEWVNGPNVRPQTWFKLYRNIAGEQAQEVLNAPVKEVDNITNTASWEDMDETDEHGKTYVYSVKEVNSTGTDLDFVPENYRKEELGSKVINTYVIPKTQKTVEKVWDLSDGENKPSQIEVVLKRELKGVVEDGYAQRAILTETNGWKHTFTDLDKTDIRGEIYTYVVVEQNHSAYDAVIENKADGSGFVITNTQKVFNKTVHKQWDNTTGETDPTSVRVHLMRDDRPDAPYQSVELSAANQWQHEFRDLPSHDPQGRAYVYTVEEDEVKGYTPVIDQSTFRITNTRKVKSIEVTKTWVDEAGSIDRPEEITIHLYKDKRTNPTPYKTAQIREGADSNVWKHEFTNLPEFDLSGRAYEYTVEEVPVPGYQSVVDQYSVTNTRELTQVPVTKVWIQTEGEYPQSVTYRLYRNGQEIASKTVSEDSWNTVFDMDDQGLKLPKTNPKTGADYSYTVEEDAVPGYTTTIQGNQITNTQDTRTIKLKKIWDKGPKPDVVLELKRRVGTDTDPNFVRRFTATSTVLESEEYIVPTHDPAGQIYDYYVEEPNVPLGYTETIRGFEVTNTYRSPQIDLKVKKEWNLGEEAQKPDLKFILYRKTQNDADFVQVPGEEKEVPKGGLIAGILNRDLIAEFTGLPVTDEDGNEYTYKVKEVKADGDEIDETVLFKPETSNERTAEQKQGETFLSAEFVNTYESPSIRVEAQKEWVDGPNTRPSTWFKLYRNVRGEQPQSVAQAQVKEVDPLTGRVSWDALEETDEHGKEYIYSVKEVNASGTDENFAPENYRKEENGLKVTNTYVIPKTEKTVEKIWELVPGEEKPAQVEVVLKRSLNTVEDNGFEERLTLKEDNAWKGNFSNLDKTDIHGVDYVYKIEEQHFDAYESEISEKEDASGFVITNRQKMTEKTARKVWVNTTGEPDPTSVTVYLIRDDKADQPYRTANLSEATQWQYEFGDLPTHDENGREYVYSLKEAEVKGYTSAVDQTAFVLTNTRQVKSIEIEKTWIDESNQVEKPDEITLHLYKDRRTNPNPYKVAKLRAGADPNVWKYEFTELPEFDLDGRAFEYSVEEVPVPGYQSAVDQYSVTNTRELVKVAVTKTWEQVEEIYPQSVTYRLHQDGQEIAVKTADRTNWNVVFETDAKGLKLPKKNIRTGKDYTYTLSEDPVVGYTATVDGHQITNKQETVGIRLSKIWINGPKPGATLLLKRKVAGQEDKSFVREFRATATLLQSEEFKLPVYNENGEKYEYFAQEDVPENYKSSIDGFEITNTYESPKIEVTGVNIFVGGPNQKPQTWLKLYRRIVITDENGNKQTVVDEEVPTDSVKSIPSSTESEMRITWVDLDKTNSSGIDYEYYVKEVDRSGNDATPPSYSKSENGLTVINNYLKYEKDVYVKKQWNRIQAGDAPEVKVFLVKNGHKTADFIQISKDTNWEGVFRDVVIKEITNGIEVQNDYTLFEEGDPNGLNNGRIVVIGRDVFEAEITGDVEQGFVITNTRLNETPPNSGGGTPPSLPDEDRPQAPWTSTPPEPTDPPTDHQGGFVEEGSSDPSSSSPRLPQVPREDKPEPKPKDLSEELKKNPVIKTKLKKKVRKKIPKTGQIYDTNFFLNLMPLAGAIFLLMGIAGKHREQ
ncbi:MAG: Cna B-type domain-containing protein [Filifactor alocis]|nr:Cna B-type domain-containing protein [Filifactor alocis]